MYLSLLQIKNFRCFDGNEHSITFKKGLNVLVGENDSGKSAIMDAIKLVLGTTDMNWYRVEQEDFYKEDATLEIKIRKGRISSYPKTKRLLSFYYVKIS